MSTDSFIRETSLIGSEAFEKIQNSNILIFGIGGVGCYIVEGLVRAGIKNFCLVDSDVFSYSNINRQLYATNSTIGKKKIEVAKERILDINPDANVEIIDLFILNEINIDFTKFTYIVDAIDTVTAKVNIIKKAKESNVNIISCMGTGNKLDPFKFKIADISKTTVCPLAKTMRKLLKDQGIKGVKVLYSEEINEPIEINPEMKNKRNAPSSISYIPSIAGLMIVSEIIKDIIK